MWTNTVLPKSEQMFDKRKYLNKYKLQHNKLNPKLLLLPKLAALLKTMSEVAYDNLNKLNLLTA